MKPYHREKFLYSSSAWRTLISQQFSMHLYLLLSLSWLILLVIKWKLTCPFLLNHLKMPECIENCLPLILRTLRPTISLGLGKIRHVPCMEPSSGVHPYCRTFPETASGCFYRRKAGKNSTGLSFQKDRCRGNGLTTGFSCPFSSSAELAEPRSRRALRPLNCSLFVFW